MAPIGDKLRENRLRWFGHVSRRPIDAPVRKVEMININGSRKGRGRPKKSLKEVIKNDLSSLGLSKEVALDRARWKMKIHVALFNFLMPCCLLHFYAC